MAGVQTISLSDLLSLCRPLTGAASISPSHCFPSLKKHKPRSPVVPTSTIAELLSTDEIHGLELSFAPLSRPVLLVGTVDLPTDPHDQLLSFSDGSTSISCVFLDFDLKVIGCRIQVIAWNFIPFKKPRGCMLEIIRWCFLPLLAMESEKSVISLRKAVQFSTRKCVVGIVRAVSQVFAVPCRNQLHGGDSIGFLVEIVRFKCSLCSNSSPDGSIKHNCNSSHASEFVYFLQPLCRWRPALVKLVGKVISISGLKRKLIYVGETTSHLMFVTNLETSVSPSLLCPDFMKHGGMNSTGMFEETCYVGVVTGVFMQGMAVELDDKAWLLLSDSNVAPEVPLRVGAVISISNFQLVHPEFSWIQIDLLVCWCKTNINIKAFSVSDTRIYFIRSVCPGLLGKFIQSLAPSARFWVLLLISCFRRKFSNVLSKKEIVGSRNKEGLVQAYARTFLPVHFIQPQHGIFMEFCKHRQPTVNHEQNQPLLKLIVPISYLMSKCELIWMSIIKKMQFRDGNHVSDNSMVARLCKGAPSMIRRIISSDDLGCILMGQFKCTSAGKLQLVDGTGSLDVVVPDILSSFYCQGIHEIRQFEVVIEGPTMQLDMLQFPCAEPLSCRNIFDKLTLRKTSNQLTVYVHFYLEDSICLNAPPIDLPCMASGCNTVPRGTTHLFRVTHKFPAAKKHMFDSEASLDFSLFAEALLLPYDVIFLDDVTLPSDNFQKTISGWPVYACNMNDHEKGCSNGLKVFDSSGKGSTASECYREQAEVGTVFPFLCFSTSCSLQTLHVAGYLCYKGATVLENLPASFSPVLLEFFSDGFMKYQSLQLGGYYTMNCSKECPFCSKKIDKNRGCTKISLSSQTILRKVSFSFSPTACQGEIKYYTSEDFLVGDYQASFRDTSQNGLLFQPSSKKLQGISDVHLVISYHLLAAFNQWKAMEEALFTHFSMMHELLTVSSTVMIMKSNLLNLRPSRCAGQSNEGLHHTRFITIRGTIESMHTCMYKNGPHLSEESIFHCDSYSNSICLHIYDSQNMIRIQGKLHENAFPVGMAPGANATFHRVLLRCCSGGFPKLVLTSVSFVVINYVKETSLLQWECTQGQEHPQFILPCLISHFEQFMNAGLGRFLCRVVTIQFLVLEKVDTDSGSSEESRLPSIKIPLAGFLLDDGSSLCCCWADGERAKVLLRLDEEKIGYHLDMMLKKHLKITVRNQGSVTDAFSVDSNKVLSNAEECLLRRIIINACQGSTLNVIGCMMDLLDREGEKCQNAMQPLVNMWAEHVLLHVNHRKEAWNLLGELSR